MRKMIVLMALIGATSLVACGQAYEVPAGVPDVRGLNLPDARAQLKQAKFAPSVTSDGMFGVVIATKWTVCKQSDPNGRLVPIEVSKEC